MKGAKANLKRQEQAPAASAAEHRDNCPKCGSKELLRLGPANLGAADGRAARLRCKACRHEWNMA